MSSSSADMEKFDFKMVDVSEEGKVNKNQVPLLEMCKNEPPHGKTNNLHRRKQRRRSVTAQLISAFVFATLIVQFLYFLNPNFRPLTIFCDCSAQFVSDLVRTKIVGFLMHSIICLWIR